MVKNKKMKILSLILIGIILGNIFIFELKETDKSVSSKSMTASKVTNEDNKIANDISNMTGATTYQILKLKSEGKNWNQILQSLKNTKENSGQSNSAKRNDTSAGDGLDKSFLQKLKNEGFSDTEITEAKILTDRVSCQLNEITSDDNNANTQSTAKVNNSKSNDEEDAAQYADLSKKIKENDSIYFMLKLKNDFSSYEKVDDEYLYSLQTDLNLEEYISDKKVYESKKQEKDAEIDKDKIITLAKIEEKALEQLQKRNKAIQQSNENNKVDEQKKADNNDKNDTLVKSPVPNVNSTRPENPNAEIMKEIDTINQNSMNP